MSIYMNYCPIVFSDIQKNERVSHKNSKELEVKTLLFLAILMTL